MNLMSDEELALSNGDAWQCEKCGKVNPVEVGMNFCDCELHAMNQRRDETND